MADRATVTATIWVQRGSADVEVTLTGQVLPGSKWTGQTAANPMGFPPEPPEVESYRATSATGPIELTEEEDERAVEALLDTYEELRRGA